MGKEVIQIISYLRPRPNTTEYTIAKSLNIEAQYTRRLLYRLQQYDLVSYFRKKSCQKGWYLSYWKVDNKKVRKLNVQIGEDAQTKIRKQLRKELKWRGQMYICPQLCVRQNAEQAINQQFCCDTCGNSLMWQDNIPTIENLRTQLR